MRAESFYNVATAENEYSRGFGERFHEKSHGESFLAMAQTNFRANGVYLLDEPEAALSPTDLLYAKFADEFERRYVSQGTDENRSIFETLDLGWDLLSILPKAELKRIKPEMIEKYLPKRNKGGYKCLPQQSTPPGRS